MVDLLRKLNLGIIGLGNQGKAHLNNCLSMKEINILGVADVSKNRLKFAEEKGIKNTYLNYEDLLKNEKLDSVIISLPNYLHAEATIKASELGKDILLEKFLARNVLERKSILSAVQKYRNRLMLGYELIFNKNLVKLHDERAREYFQRHTDYQLSICGLLRLTYLKLARANKKINKWLKVHKISL